MFSSTDNLDVLVSEWEFSYSRLRLIHPSSLVFLSYCCSDGCFISILMECFIMALWHFMRPSKRAQMQGTMILSDISICQKSLLFHSQVLKLMSHLDYTERFIYHFQKDVFLFFCGTPFVRVLFSSFWSTNFIFFPILPIFTVRKMDFVRVKIENLLHESQCLVQQLVFCLPEFNCGGSVDREHYSLLKVCGACEFKEICSAVTGWVRTEAEMVPNLPASCVWRKMLQPKTEKDSNW